MINSNSASANGRAVPYYNVPPQQHQHWPRLLLVEMRRYGPLWVNLRMRDLVTHELIDFEFPSHCPQAVLWQPARMRGPMARPAPVTVEPRPWWRRLMAWIGGGR